MMTLQEYLNKTGRGAAAALARETGLSESQITRLARNGNPLLKTAFRIQDATRGAVPVEVWRAQDGDAA